MLRGFDGTGAIKEIFVWSDLDSPTKLRDEWLLPFEAASKTIRIDMKGPVDESWVLRFTDLQKPTQTAGVFEEYVFYLQTHCDNRLWEIYTLRAPPFRRTIGALVRFVPKLNYALFPPSFVKDLIESYSPNQELTAFKAERDYFSIEIGNPSERIRHNFAQMKYKSSNVPEDFVTLVEKKPVGSLLLTSADFKITYHASQERTCRIRIEIDGRLSQVGRGDSDIFLEIRKRVLDNLLVQHDKTLASTPVTQLEVIKDSESGTEITSREIMRQSVPILVKLSSPIDESTHRIIVGLFSRNIRGSNFFGTVERKSDSGVLIKTTDVEGGGDAFLNVPFSEDTILISPMATTTVRTVSRIYRVILEKVDVDSILAYATEEEVQ